MTALANGWKIGRGIIACLLLVIVLQVTARAHAFLDKADPAVGSEVRMAPSQVRIWFTENVEPAFSTVRVLDKSGKQIDRKDVKVPSDQRSELTVSLPSLPPGTYKVFWNVIAEDTHRTQGSFSFTLKSQ